MDWGSVFCPPPATSARKTRSNVRAKRKHDAPQEDDPQDVEEITCTPSPAERLPDSPKDDDAASTPGERSQPQRVDDTFAGGEISESTAGPSQANETPVSTKQPLKRKTRLVFSPEDQNQAKKPKKEDELQRSCSATAHFIPIGNIKLPTQARQFRRVNDEFVSSLEAEMERNPAGSYGALFVVTKEITNKDEWKLKDKDSYTYEVLGGTHLSLATKRMHEKQPNNPHFAGRMCRIYVGLSAEQAVYLGGMHQQSSMFQHEITYREEVEQCRMQLFGCSDVSGDPPEPKSSWRDDCSCILHKEKKGLSEVFAMARVAKDVWKEFQEVNSLCEKGSLKDQKVSAGEVMRGFVSLKQWHMKPLCSLSDEQKLYLLKKLKEKEISLKELKQEANNVKALSQVQEAIMNFFQLKSWEEARTKFGNSVCSERLLRFRGDFEKLHDFKMFLKHLQNKTEHTREGQADGTVITGSDGVTKGCVVFSRYADVDASSSCLGNGAFLSIGHAGYNSEDVVQEVKDIVDMVISINFKWLMTIFNVIIICPVRASDLVAEALTTSGAAKTQQGFIVDTNRKRESKTKDLVMTEAVSSFVVGHWAVARQMVDRHVSRCTTNVLLVQNKESNKQQKEVYEQLLTTFSEQGDLILDIGSGNGNGLLAGLRLKRPSVYIDQWTEENDQWHLLEDIKEQLQFIDNSQ